jgi:hypothetical protein
MRRSLTTPSGGVPIVATVYRHIEERIGIAIVENTLSLCVRMGLLLSGIQHKPELLRLCSLGTTLSKPFRATDTMTYDGYSLPRPSV